MKRTQFAAITLAALCVGATAGALMQDASQDGMPPEMAAMMAAWEKASVVTEHHKALEPFVGTFDAEMTMWMAPGMPPTVSTGTMHNNWILGGRFVEQSYQSELEGQPFHGRGLWGFDVAANQHNGLWIDNMSTGLNVSLGPVSEDGKTWRAKMTSTDPMTGEPRLSEHVTILESHDRHRFEMFEMHGGERVRTMEIVYTRRK